MQKKKFGSLIIVFLMPCKPQQKQPQIFVLFFATHLKRLFSVIFKLKLRSVFNWNYNFFFFFLSSFCVFVCRRQSMGAWTTATVQSDQPLNNAPLLRSPTKPTSDERLKVATNDLFELLERVQCSRLDDQRCVLPAYFLQQVSNQLPF